VRDGPRAALVEALIKAHGAVPTGGDDRLGIEPRIPFRVTEFLPSRSPIEQAVKLRFAFFLRGRGDHPSFEEFRLTDDDFETVLKPLTYDAVVATSWGSTPGSWLIKHLQLRRALQSVRCFHVDAGTPDATADAIERIVKEDRWDCR
jgi:hypothetical protein